MKKRISFLFSLCLFFCMGFATARFKNPVEIFLSKKSLPNEISAPLRPAAYPLQNRPFAVIAIGRNNGATVEKTLRSIFSQNYENFRLIYVDDASDDGSFEHVQSLIYERGGALRFQIVQNTKPLGDAESLFRTARMCDEDEIVVVLQGDDRLAHEWVLQKLNQYYAHSDLWMAEGKGVSPDEFKISASRLHSFYAALIKKMPESETFHLNALAETAKDHTGFADEVLFLSQEKQGEF